LAALHAPFDLHGQDVAIRASIGVAVGWPGRSHADDLLRHADQALYRAKATGRATYAIFNPGLGDEASRRSALETDLRRAVERGELALRYQPLVDLSDGRVAGAEALVRWAHPTRGLVAPSEFIDLAEESGLIVPLGAFVLEEACRQAAAWRRKYPEAPSLVMGVNLSGRQVRDPELAATVARVLASTGLPPSSLRLELTEQVLVDNSPATASTLMALKALGVQLAIDDFGTGYSSLGSLRHLPVEGLKIDRSFVTGMGLDPSASAIIEAFVALARALDLAVTAEGIETPEELDRVRAAGCEIGQGFLFGPPVTPEAFEMHLAVGSVSCPYRVPNGDLGEGARLGERAPSFGLGFTR
jgi:EAL domain-containing protein (putative c-di-GMP-specific phosphodiesterase class I)